MCFGQAVLDAAAADDAAAAAAGCASASAMWGEHALSPLHRRAEMLSRGGGPGAPAMLCSLVLSHLPLEGGETLACLSDLVSLRCLRLEHCPALATEALRDLQRLTRLEVVSLSGCARLVDGRPSLRTLAEGVRVTRDTRRNPIAFSGSNLFVAEPPPQPAQPGPLPPAAPTSQSQQQYTWPTRQPRPDAAAPGVAISGGDAPPPQQPSPP